MLVWGCINWLCLAADTLDGVSADQLGALPTQGQADPDEQDDPDMLVIRGDRTPSAHHMLAAHHVRARFAKG